MKFDKPTSPKGSSYSSNHISIFSLESINNLDSDDIKSVKISLRIWWVTSEFSLMKNEIKEENDKVVKINYFFEFELVPMEQHKTDAEKVIIVIF